jgi:hypothetical protein
MADDIDPNPACDLCPRPATVHQTDIVDGHLTERHLCWQHAAESHGLTTSDPSAASAFLASLLSTETHAMSGLAAQLRGTANYIRRHGRPPRTVDELDEGMSLRPPFPTAPISDPNLLTYLKESDAFLESFESFTPPLPDEPT